MRTFTDLSAVLRGIMQDLKTFTFVYNYQNGTLVFLVMRETQNCRVVNCDADLSRIATQSIVKFCSKQVHKQSQKCLKRFAARSLCWLQFQTNSSSNIC